MLLKACVNGARRPSDHPALPVTAAELAADVVRIVAAGAGAVHLHLKDEAGDDTLDGATLAEVLTRIRRVTPGVPLGVTTGAWAAPDPQDRLRAIRGWSVLPDFASVNWHEAGADDVAAALLARGVGVEAGLWHADAVARWLESAYRDRCCRVLIELPDRLDEAATMGEADRLLASVASVGSRLPVLLHGEGTSCWPALRRAGQLGLQTRIGLEDVLHLPDRTPAPDNVALVTAARSVLAATRAARR